MSFPQNSGDMELEAGHDQWRQTAVNRAGAREDFPFANDPKYIRTWASTHRFYARP
jgi:hypothetical protein